MTSNIPWGWDAPQASAALLTPSEMAEADRRTIASGTAGMVLMRRAGAAVARAVISLQQQKGLAGRPFLVLCGPGNNGGDGFVAAAVLRSWGVPVQLYLLAAREALSGDAGEAADTFEREGGVIVVVVDAGPIRAALQAASGLVVIDALFGAGLSRPLEGLAAAVVEAVNRSVCPVLAVDVPSGLDGASGMAPGAVVRADRTVTFARKKPGHLLLPGRLLCGRTEVCDIGISNETISDIAPAVRRNGPAAWPCPLPRPGREAHKYSRGAVLAFSGPFSMTGAIRLSAEAALRVGAGLVTVACEPSATAALVSHLTAVMVRPLRDPAELEAALADPRLSACLVGPGAGWTEARAPALVDRVLQLASARPALVLDADALSVFKGAPEQLLMRLRQRPDPAVLTPHAGEFRSLFPDLVQLDRLSGARVAAQRSSSIIVLKGPDTVIAAPDGRAYINDNAPPCLATAGSGDVLAGLVAGLLAQGVPAFEAAAIAVYLHGAAGAICGEGMTAEDLLPALPQVLAGQLAE